MSILPSGLDLSSTNVASEYAKKQDSIADNKLINDTEVQKDSSDSNKVANENHIEKEASQVIDNKPLSPEQLEKVAQQLQEFVGEMNKGLEFSVDKDSGRDVIKVIDKSSGDLVKQYPSEEVLTLVSKLSDMVGGFVDAKV